MVISSLIYDNRLNLPSIISFCFKMAARMSSVKTAFLLFTEDQEENCEKLRTVLEYNSDGCICIVDLVDVRGASLEEKLRDGCDCILLVCSSRAVQLINDEESSIFKTKSGHRVKFDGKIISKVLKCSDGRVRKKVIPVSFVELPSALHQNPEERKKCRYNTISFEIKQGEVNEEMLEGDVLVSLIDAIKKAKP